MPARPSRLQTAYAANPLGIDDRNPVLRWRVDTARRGARQTAFRVLVASTPDRLASDDGDVWDTGKRTTDRPAVRYDGPPLDSDETYHWKVRIWDEHGDPSPWSDPATWGMGLLDPDDWSAAWIRRPTDDADSGEFSYVRTEVDLDGEIARARAYVSASHQYALSVDGETVDRGQAYSYPDYQYYKTVDLTDALRRGRNAIGALYSWYGAGQGRPAAEPGFILQLHVEFVDGRERTIATDGSWRASEGPWLDTGRRNDEIAEPIEVIDANQIPEGWAEPGFDDAAWDPVEVVGVHPTDPWERLVAQVREVTRSEIDPASVERIADDSYLVDFGRVYAGVPAVEFHEGTAGHRVDLRAGYRLDEDGKVADAEGTQWTDMSYGYVQRAGDQTFRPFFYLGFRYLQIDDPGEDLDPDQISLVARRNEVPDEHAARFESANDTVDDVFELARHSARYGSQEQFVDTPTREKGQFLLDALNISRTTTRAFGERRLTRGAIREFVRSHYRYWAAEGRLNAVYPNGDGKRDIPDFTVAFPEWVWRFYTTSGDRQTMEDAYPVIRAVADYVVRHVNDETGLVMNLSGGEGGPYEEGIVDWPPEMRYGYDRDWPARTTVNVLCANALRRAATIAEELGRPEAERAYYRDTYETITTAIDTHLRDGDRYVDGGDGEERSDHASQHANAFPLAVGLVDEDRVDAVAEHVADRGMRMGPMMVPWLLEALDAADRPAAVVDLLTDPSQDGWANILDAGGTFTWETWHCRDPDLPPEERHNRSESHAMGATVLVTIQETLLGVRVREPEGARVEIRPPASGLASAMGRVPTERGAVEIEWERGNEFRIDATVPWNTRATIVVPDADDEIRVNGELIRPTDEPVRTNDESARPADESRRVDPALPDGVHSVERTGDAVRVEVGAGRYEIRG